MLVIRLQRTGRENLPTYRIVLSEKARHVKKGAKEIFGHYLPNRATPVFECNQERVSHWMKLGAIPSDTVARLLAKAGMKDMQKYFLRYTKRKSKNAPAEEAAIPAAAAPAAPAEEKPAA